VTSCPPQWRCFLSIDPSPFFFADVIQTVISFGRGEEGIFSPMGCAKLLIVGLREHLRFAAIGRHETEPEDGDRQVGKTE
jgi:hypothetical protein